MDLRETIVATRAAARRLAALTGEERGRLLSDLAAALERPAIRQAVLAANAEDMGRANADLAAGRLAAPLVKRLALDDRKLDSTVDGLRQLAAMPELVGQLTT